jgi:SAM-dependent methyltransferase
MADWQERITRETAPAIRAEHDLRYRLAAPLIAASAGWADLGCGNGVAAAAALQERPSARAVLVDIDESVVARAAEELGLPDAVCLAADLTDPDALRRIGAELLECAGERIVTCFEVVEHLSSFVPLLEWSVELAREGAATFVISVPNDAFWSIQNPHHLSSWGEGAFEELHRLLPREQTLLRQISLTGSAMIGWDGEPTRYELLAEIGGERAVASHFIAAFGPRHDELWRGALATQGDVLGQRRWERQRENDVALAQKELEVLEQELAQARAYVEQSSTWFAEWRAYIHELERQLNLPLSGAGPDELPEVREPPAESPQDQATPPQ